MRRNGQPASDFNFRHQLVHRPIAGHRGVHILREENGEMTDRDGDPPFGPILIEFQILNSTLR